MASNNNISNLNVLTFIKDIYNSLKYMEQSLKEIGVQKIYMGTKLHMDISPILTHLGYKQIEKSFAKVI